MKSGTTEDGEVRLGSLEEESYAFYCQSPRAEKHKEAGAEYSKMPKERTERKNDEVEGARATA